MLVKNRKLLCPIAMKGSTKKKRREKGSMGKKRLRTTALASATQEVVLLCKLATDVKLDFKGPMLIYEDNQSTIAMSKNPQFHGRSKHIDIKFDFVRDQCNVNAIQLKYCPTDDMIADVFTKGLSHVKFKRLRNMLGMYAN